MQSEDFHAMFGEFGSDGGDQLWVDIFSIYFGANAQLRCNVDGTDHSIWGNGAVDMLLGGVLRLCEGRHVFSREDVYALVVSVGLVLDETPCAVGEDDILPVFFWGISQEVAERFPLIAIDLLQSAFGWS